MENEVGAAFRSSARNGEAVVPRCVTPGDASAWDLGSPNPPYGARGGGDSLWSIFPALWRLPASSREKQEFLLVCSVRIGLGEVNRARDRLVEGDGPLWYSPDPGAGFLHLPAFNS